MDDSGVGRVLREVRRRRRLSQAEVATRAGVSQSTVSRLERGHLDDVALGRIRAIARVLEVRVVLTPSWRGGDAARLVDAAHAALVEATVVRLERLGWEVVLEATFNEFGERGAIDVLAWQADRRALLVIEVKSRIVDAQDLLSGLDRKTRLAPVVASRAHGWRADRVGCVLVLPAGSTSRQALLRHRATFAVALPARTSEVRHWLRHPDRPLRGILAVTDMRHMTRMRPGRRSGATPRA